MSASIDLAPTVPLVVPPTRVDPTVTRKAVPLSPAKQTFRSVWFFLLVGSICFEGLGRRYLPGVPAVLFYFSKDAVLLLGLFRFRINRDVMKIFRSLYGPFLPFLKLGILWTFAELVNPGQRSFVLGLLGIRAYWLWWIAPLVVASVLLDPVVRRKVVVLQAVVTIIVAGLAMLQFGAPVNDPLNTYSVVDGQESMAFAVETTGRPRVSSTFSFISGFADFAILVPVLLLSIGLGEKDRRARLAALIAVLLAAAALPMSGSRGPFLTSLALCGVVAWRAGLVFTAVGRRVIFLAAAAIVTSVYAFPDAIQGVMDRLEGDDTSDRATEFLTILPPVAFMKYGTTPLGIGTGMMQNYRQQLGVQDAVEPVEAEVARYMVELGTIGYLLVWIAKLGLAMTLWRCSKILKKGGRPATSAGALVYAFLGISGNLVFDHIYSALFFVGFGFIFTEVVQVRLSANRRSAPVKAPPEAAPMTARTLS